jgi:hypothetical protein
VIYALLNQSQITSLLTVDYSNINCGTDLPIDSIASLQNKTVQEGLNNLLLVSNSVLYIEGDTVFVSPRVATDQVIFNFYGQTSPNGAENIIDIQNIRNGLNRVLNYFTWKDTTLFSQSLSSVAKYGALTKELSADFVTLGTSQQTIMDNLCAEFADPKQEFSITTPMSYKSLACTLLSRVSVDYPIVYVSTGDPVPLCGAAVCGEAILPKALSAFKLSPTDYYYVIGRSVNSKDSTITFKLRRM